MHVKQARSSANCKSPHRNHQDTFFTKMLNALGLRFTLSFLRIFFVPSAASTAVKCVPLASTTTCLKVGCGISPFSDASLTVASRWEKKSWHSLTKYFTRATPEEEGLEHRVPTEYITRCKVCISCRRTGHYRWRRGTIHLGSHTVCALSPPSSAAVPVLCHGSSSVYIYQPIPGVAVKTTPAGARAIRATKASSGGHFDPVASWQATQKAVYCLS